MRVRVSSIVIALLGLAALIVAGTWWAMQAPAPVPFDRAVVSVLAGPGLDEPFGVAVTAGDAILVSDGAAHRLRSVGSDGRVTTLAGSTRGFLDGPADRARFATPSAIAVAGDGTVYVADTGNHAIRRVTPDGVVTTLAGTGAPGLADGDGAQARFDGPVGIAVDATGRVVVADTYNDRIRVIDAHGSVRTIAGGDQPGFADGTGSEARFDTPCGVAIEATGHIVVADTGNGVLRRIDGRGMVTTVQTAGVGLDRPIALAADVGGDLVVADESGAIVRVGRDGEARLMAGGRPGFAEGDGEDARFRRPSGVVVTVRPGVGGGRVPALLVADAGNGLLRLLRPAAAPTRAPMPRRLLEWTHTPQLDPPRPPLPRPAFDAEAFARVALPWPVPPQEGPHEIAGTFAEVRGEAGEERFHAGLDVRQEQGTPVLAVRDGTVASPMSTSGFETLNEAVRVGELAYIHIRAGRTAEATRPRRSARSASGSSPDLRGIDVARFDPVFDEASGTLTRVRVRRGAFFATGDVVGTVNRFNHVHLNVGWPGEEHNPLRFRLVGFTDRIVPTIATHGVRLFDEAGVPLNPDRPGPPRGRGRNRRPTVLPPLSPVVVTGRVRIVVDAWDQADGNAVYRRLGLYALGYEVHRAGATGSAPIAGSAPPTLVFDRMPRERDAARLVFASGSGIPVYGASRTQFLYVVTTRYRDGVVSPGWWDTTGLAPGRYVLRVFGEDFSGNRVTRDLDVVVPRS